ncbi:MAG TPA: hypothetical protein VHU83_16970 [Bryobacteraceae bacterium]|jgi:hypothetical protein|nr:hypothetical protein [Bryobacteraceae bacterium]
MKVQCLRESQAKLNNAGRHDTWEPGENGFEFSSAEVELRALDIEPDLFAGWADENAAA